jgi:CheY-like chemotaxis protein
MDSKKILVIDDDDGVRELIQICLETVGGWKVITAASGSEGLVTAATQQPDLILLDVMMSIMDGVLTFRQIQNNQKIKHIPTIFLTAKAKISEQRWFRDLGVTGVITKPFEPYNLVAQIKRILNWQD